MRMTSSDSMRKFKFRNYFASVNAFEQNMQATSAMLTRTFVTSKSKRTHHSADLIWNLTGNFANVAFFPQLYYQLSILSLKSLLHTCRAQRSIFFSIPHLMLGGIWGHHVNQWVKTSPTAPLPGLCTLGEILPYMTSLSVGKISPDV